MAGQTCYMCDGIATSREHVPPLCLFPEDKDLGMDCRKNLTTVPSCDAHNLKKTKDDVYLMMALTCYIMNNEIAMKHINTKILRAWKRDPKLVNLINDRRPVLFHGELTDAFRLDMDRLNRSLICVAHGLYYKQHRFLKKWSFKISIQSPAMLFLESKDAPNRNALLNHMGQSVNEVLSDLPKIGENPDVFWYQFLSNKPDEFLINMIFFGGLQVLAVSKSIVI